MAFIRKGYCLFPVTSSFYGAQNTSTIRLFFLGFFWKSEKINKVKFVDSPSSQHSGCSTYGLSHFPCSFLQVLNTRWQQHMLPVLNVWDFIFFFNLVIKECSQLGEKKKENKTGESWFCPVYLTFTYILIFSLSRDLGIFLMMHRKKSMGAEGGEKGFYPPNISYMISNNFWKYQHAE